MLYLCFSLYNLNLGWVNNCHMDSPASRTALEGLEDAVREFNRDTPDHKLDELIDRRTNFAALVDFACKDLADRYPDRKQAKRKRDQVWWKIKHALERFCRVVYSFSSVMDVLASSHPEIASLACTFYIFVSSGGEKEL